MMTVMSIIMNCSLLRMHRYPRYLNTEKYMEEWDSTLFKSYGATMQGYVLVPDSYFEDLDTLANYLNESYDYVMTLEPK